MRAPRHLSSLSVSLLPCLLHVLDPPQSGSRDHIIGISGGNVLHACKVLPVFGPMRLSSHHHQRGMWRNFLERSVHVDCRTV